MKQNKKRFLDYLQNEATLFDDIMFREVASNSKFVQELLQVLLNDKNLILISHEVQKQLNIYDCRGVILDCYCRLSDGKIVNIEVERNDEKNKCNHVKRVRHYSSMITVKNLKPGETTDDLPDVYIIYLTLKDFFKRGKTVYHIDRTIRECGDINDNGIHEIYINAEINDHSNIAEVMKIMSTNDYVNNNFSEISKAKEEHNMPAEIEEVYNELKTEWKAEGKVEGEVTGTLKTIVKMYKNKQIGIDIALNNLNITEKEFLQKVQEYQG